MSYGRDEKPCDNFTQGTRHMLGLCGVCAWKKEDHSEYAPKSVKPILKSFTQNIRNSFAKRNKK